MNVLNVADIERELNRLAARALNPHAGRWMLTVARNHILSKLSEKDVLANFRDVAFQANAVSTENHAVSAETLPDWGKHALAQGDTLKWFDPVQVRRRELWTVLEVVMLWFNSWNPADTRFPRIDRISMPVAVESAVLWKKDVSEHIWNYVMDKPVLVYKCIHGYSWVNMVTALQFEREGKLMAHCVGNQTYYNKWRTTGLWDYFSLRDRNNEPHCTLEVHYDSRVSATRKGAVVQCKGKTNTRPAEVYQPYIAEFLRKMNFGVVGDSAHIRPFVGSQLVHTNTPEGDPEDD